MKLLIRPSLETVLLKVATVSNQQPFSVSTLCFPFRPPFSDSPGRVGLPKRLPSRFSQPLKIATWSVKSRKPLHRLPFTCDSNCLATKGIYQHSSSYKSASPFLCDNRKLMTARFRGRFHDSTLNLFQTWPPLPDHPGARSKKTCHLPRQERASDFRSQTTQTNPLMLKSGPSRPLMPTVLKSVLPFLRNLRRK